MVAIDEPTRPDANADQFELDIWKIKFQEYTRYRNEVQSCLRNTFSIVWGQCTEKMRAKLNAQEGFKLIKQKKDTVDLLVMIKKLTHLFDSRRYPIMLIVAADLKLRQFYQGREMSTEQYYRSFMELSAIILGFGGYIGNHPFMVKSKLGEITGAEFDDKRDYTQEQRMEAIDQAREKYLACLFLMNSCKHCYGYIVTELHNDYLIP